jgi:hypothetical protein
MCTNLPDAQDAIVLIQLDTPSLVALVCAIGIAVAHFALHEAPATQLALELVAGALTPRFVLSAKALRDFVTHEALREAPALGAEEEASRALSGGPRAVKLVLGVGAVGAAVADGSGGEAVTARALELAGEARVGICGEEICLC